jgi:hypothetical protein
MEVGIKSRTAVGDVYLAASTQGKYIENIITDLTKIISEAVRSNITLSIGKIIALT